MDTIGLVLELEQEGIANFMTHVLPQVVDDIKSAMKSMKRASKVFHVLIDSSNLSKELGGYKDKNLAILPMEIAAAIRRGGWDAIYYSVDSSGKHTTTKEPEWFNGSQYQRYEANEVITAECSIIVSGGTIETDRYRDMIHHVKNRKVTIRVVKPGSTSWYMPDDKKNWAKLRGQLGEANRELGIVSSAHDAPAQVADSEDAFDTGGETNIVEARQDATDVPMMSGKTACFGDKNFEEFICSVVGAAYMCSEIHRAEAGKFTINPLDSLKEYCIAHADRAKDLQKGMPYQFYLDDVNYHVSVKLPPKLTGCNDKQCDAVCGAISNAMNMLAFYGSADVAHTRITDDI